MNKLRLLTFLLLSAFLIQSCKKDTIVGTAYTTAAFQANINGVAWAPADTLSSVISYNSAAKTKTYTLSGTRDQEQVVMSITLSSATNTPGFTLGTYNVDGTSVKIAYNTLQKDSSGAYVYLPHGAVSPGGGIIYVTAIDSVKKQITGTFQFYSRSSTTDGSGNTSTTVDNILGGEFNSLPYTFTSN
jgi:hypothetical protein